MAKALSFLRPRKIFGKVLFGYVLLTLLIVLIAGSVSYYLVRNSVIKTNERELLQKAETAASMISSPGGRSRVLIGARMIEFQALADAQMVYIVEESDGESAPHYIAQYVPSRVSGDHDSRNEFQKKLMGALDTEFVGGILGGLSISDVRKFELTGNDETVIAGAPVWEKGVVTGAVVFMRPLEDVSNTASSIFAMFMRAGLASLIAAFLLALVISRKLTHPILQLNTAAARVADGHYGETVDLRQSDEIGALGGTLNLLSTRLSDVICNLRDEKRKLKQIIDGIGEGIVAVDRVGNVVEYNPSALELLEIPASRATESARDLAHEQRLLSMLSAAIATGRHADATWINSSGATIAVSVSAFAGDDGEILGAVGLLRDVSESERLEQMRRDYIANISHELRTPLTGIRGMTEPLIDGVIETEAERQSSYEIIYQETLRLERLIGDMLDLSRLQDGRATIECEPMQPRELLLLATRRVRSRAAELDIDLSTDIPDEEITVLGNEDRIVQALTIFLDNALSFTPRGGAIRAFIRKENGRALFGVSDTGPGIEEADLPYIFERFYKADKSRMGTKGTGLGLAIAKLLVERMGGTISVETKPQAGSTFTFSLPLATLSD